MSKEITLNAVPIASEATIQKVLDAFEAQHKIHVTLMYTGWGDYRQEFTNIALHHLPGDVAIMGMTATSDLVAMNSLRPFTRGEIGLLGGESSFLPSRWQAGMRPGDSNVWAIPFIVDPRILYYRRDLLKKAKVKEAGAFDTPEHMEQTINRLQAAGVDVPWFIVGDRFGVMHRVSSWIWAYNGHLFAPDGKRVTFHEKEALEGIRAYLRLIRCVPAQGVGPNGRDLFLSGKVGVMIDNAFMLYYAADPNIGCTPVPGASYVGGSDLAIWNHTRNESAAMELVRFLTQPDVTAQLMPEMYYLPARMGELNALAARSDPYSATIAQAVFNGRTFPCVPMIGLVEERLGATLLSIQQELLADPKADLEALLQRVIALGKRTNLTLGSLP